MNYRLKPRTVQAEQWFPDRVIEGVTLILLEYVYSEDKQFFYVRNGPELGKGWLSVDVSVSKPKEAGGGVFSPVTMEISLPGKEPYYRVYLPFAFWSMKALDKPEVIKKLEDDLFLDYAASQGWKEFKSGYRAALAGHGGIIHPGDWIITDGDSKSVLTIEQFEARYEHDQSDSSSSPANETSAAGS